MGNTADENVNDMNGAPLCQTCNSENVVKDAWARFNPETDAWELDQVFDHEHCLFELLERVDCTTPIFDRQ